MRRPVWDETKVLDGSTIGELTVMARRTGDVWYVGILNGDQAKKTYSLDLSFLSEGEYEIQIASDDLESPRVNLEGRNPKAKLKEFTTAIPCKVASRTLKHNETLAVELAAGGGFMAKLIKR